MLGLLDALLIPLHLFNLFWICFNEGFGMELLRAWEPSVSLSVAWLGATMGSQFCFLIGNETKKEQYG